MKKYFLLICLLLFLNKSNSYAQSIAKDSLKSIINSNNAKPEIIGTTLLALGDVYFLENKYAEALDCYNKSCDIGKKIKNSRLEASALNNIAIIYNKNGNLNKCIQTMEKSLVLSLMLKDNPDVARTYLNLGFFYNLNNNSNKAIECLEKALELAEKYNDKSIQAFALANIGGIYTKQRAFKKADSCLNISISIREKLGNKKLLSESLTLLSKLLFEKKEYPLALIKASASLLLAKESQKPILIKEAALIRYKINKASNNSIAALADYELFVEMKDSSANEKNKKASIQKEFQIAYDKKVVADSIKQIEHNKVKDLQILAQKGQLKQEKIVRIALFFGAFLILTVAVFIYTRFKITQKQKLIIEKQKHLLEGKQKEILDSIHYAKRIQMSLLPNETKISKSLNKITKK